VGNNIYLLFGSREHHRLGENLEYKVSTEANISTNYKHSGRVEVCILWDRIVNQSVHARLYTDYNYGTVTRPISRTRPTHGQAIAVHISPMVHKYTSTHTAIA
jgi:hypothetical protein